MSDEYRLELWQRRKRSSTPEAFEARYRHPFLVRPLRAKAGTEEPAEDYADRLSFQTGVVDVGERPVRLRGRLESGQVLPLVKKPGNPYPDLITLGRALNCDVVVRDPSVSKLHCHLRLLAADRAELTAVRSQNGTHVNGTRLSEGRSRIVTAGDTIVVGGVALRFVDAKGLYEIL